MSSEEPVGAQGLSILLIDDDHERSGSLFWKEAIEKLGGTAVVAPGESYPELLDGVNSILNDPNTRFNGVILDVLMPEQPRRMRGGIDLWNTIRSEHHRLGELMVATKSDGDYVRNFADTEAHGRLCDSIVRADKLAMLDRLLRDIDVQ